MTLNVSLMYKVNLINFINHYLHQLLMLTIYPIVLSVRVGYHMRVD